jgi:hypothetical protein
MNKDQYFAFHADFCRRMEDVTRRKNADYTGDDSDPFANFRLVEKLRIASVEQGFLTRMADKISRITSLTTQEAQVKDESIEDTLHDLANYCALFAGYLRSKKSASAVERQLDRDWLAALNAAVGEERYYEIVAKGRACEVVIERCPDVELAANRFKKLQEEWPSFQLSIREVLATEEDDGHQEAS